MTWLDGPWGFVAYVLLVLLTIAVIGIGLGPVHEVEDAEPARGTPTFTYDENGRHCIGFTHDAMGWREIIPDDLDNMEPDDQPLEHCSLPGGGQ